MSPASRVEDLLRREAPRVLGTLVRRHGSGQFAACEDAVQEALVAATTQWPADGGVPDDPHAWLVTVAGRRLTDMYRSESARREREERVAWAEERLADSAVGDEDDALELLLLCAHPVLSPPSQLALTLRAVGGLTTAQIASAFLVPEATMAQRISRAKAMVRRAGARFSLPEDDAERAERLRVVLHVLYLMFNEGYTATSGAALARAELTREALRIARLVRARLPEDGEVAGLLALMLLTDARRGARTDAAGELVPLAEQDRAAWNAVEIAEGLKLVAGALSSSALGPYQLQAAIAAVHAEAARAEDTDWRQIALLYRLLERLTPGNPMVSLNRAVAVAEVEGPEAGLALLEALAEPLADSHRLAAVRAHLLERAGDATAARDAYLDAARATLSLPERRYLERRAAQLSP